MNPLDDPNFDEVYGWCPFDVPWVCSKCGAVYDPDMPQEMISKYISRWRFSNPNMEHICRTNVPVEELKFSRCDCMKEWV